MNDAPFDINVHPTPGGTWIDNRPGMSFSDLHLLIEGEWLSGACAVSLPPQSPGEHKEFLSCALDVPRVVPVAGVSGTSTKEVVSDIRRVAKMGFPAIKIHPRFLDFSYDAATFSDLLNEAETHSLVVYICTYYWTSNLRLVGLSDPLLEIVRSVARFPNTHVILAHGGAVRVMELIEYVRFLPNTWLDLSLTLTKYVASPVESALRFAVQNFDQRVLFGSDSPDSSMWAALSAIQNLTRDLDPEKRRRILSGNASSIFPITR